MFKKPEGALTNTMLKHQLKKCGVDITTLRFKKPTLFYFTIATTDSATAEEIKEKMLPNITDPKYIEQAGFLSGKAKSFADTGLRISRALRFKEGF